MATESDLPVKYRRPKLMIVGDSLAQGCRSLTVKASFCSQSYGALLAQSQGWAHIPAQHPLPVVADVEDLVRRSGSINVFFRVARMIHENITSWREVFAKPPAGTPLCFDNVAIAASDMGEIAGHGADDYGAAFENALAAYDAAGGLKKLAAAASMHLPINGRYVLNPTGDGAFNDLSQLDWAFLRKPQHLIAHFGHNNGIYPIGGLGKVPGGSGLLAMKKAYLDTVKQILGAPAGIEHIILVLLPKISCVANLDPEGDLLPGSTYFESYKTTFPFNDAAISGKDLERLDNQIKEINGEARILVGAAQAKRKVTVIDAYQVFSRFDYKNTGSSAAQIRIGATVIDNRYLRGRLLPGPVINKGPAVGSPKYTFGRGGFQSLDGMHLTAVGYAVLADQIAIALNLKRDASILKTALKNEKLITHFPSPLQGFHNLLNVSKSIIDLLSSGADTIDTEAEGKGKKGAPVVVGMLARRLARS